MADHEAERSYNPSPHDSKQDWDAIDSPTLTADELAEFRPLNGVEPELAKMLRGLRGAQTARAKLDARAEP